MKKKDTKGKQPGNASYYYSCTRLKTDGKMHFFTEKNFILIELGGWIVSGAQVH
ncbi:MAG: lipocalin-like domain-containing protein [Ignavibacteriaceae bacterium]|nr:lipocalin-like domain-containing protein [Ignavibacteriaceae bacterium]